MVLAKAKVECVLKCKLLINNLQSCIVEKLRKENTDTKTKNRIMNITEKFEMNNE